MKSATLCGFGVLATVIAFARSEAQDTQFSWVNPLPEGAHERLTHGTFHSESMGGEVGYVVYLPPGYEDPDNADRHYPVVYWLHGGQIGSEFRGISMTERFDRRIRRGTVPPRIYVFVNGGRLSHYDYGQSLGETAFVKELIPHVDRTYRTVQQPLGRAIEGFSAGGRGTARIMFRYPELFCSAAPMGGGHQHEKGASENRGEVRVGAVTVTLDDPKNNSWDRAHAYAALEEAPPLEILVVVGTRGMNYEANLEWMRHLESLGIAFERRIVPDVGHNVGRLYQNVGDEIMLFHERCFAKVAEDAR